MLRLRALTPAEQSTRDRLVRELEDKYLSLAYAAEATGNYRKYDYYLGWARRAGEMFSPENVAEFNRRYAQKEHESAG
jgi:hypothetical protein